MIQNRRRTTWFLQNKHEDFAAWPPKNIPEVVTKYKAQVVNSVYKAQTVKPAPSETL